MGIMIKSSLSLYFIKMLIWEQTQ